MGSKRNGKSKSEVIRNVPMACANEGAAVVFLERLRWGDNASHACPRCGSDNVYVVGSRKTEGERNEDYRWRCRSCGKFHTMRTGTVMERSLIPMRHWCLAFWRACSSKKGVSAKQIQRETGLSYKSALFLMHRIRYALADMPGCKLSDVVEVDETYVGGKPRRGGVKSKPGRGTKKQPVMVLVQRDGNAHARVIPNVTAKTLRAAIREHVDAKAVLNTDDFPAYRPIGRKWPGGHDVVRHSQKEYSRGNTHTNTAESFFALLKRGIFGTFHAVSKRHLHRYVSEFVFRWNTRKASDGERIAAALFQSQGKRLMYREPCVV